MTGKTQGHMRLLLMNKIVLIKICNHSPQTENSLFCANILK